MTTDLVTPVSSSWCRLLSTEGHQHCGGCDCTCHEKGSYGGENVAQRRPHSFPRPDWAAGRRPKSWVAAKAARKRQQKLLGLVDLD